MVTLDTQDPFGAFGQDGMQGALAGAAAGRKPSVPMVAATSPLANVAGGAPEGAAGDLTLAPPGGILPRGGDTVPQPAELEFAPNGINPIPSPFGSQGASQSLAANSGGGGDGGGVGIAGAALGRAPGIGGAAGHALRRSGLFRRPTLKGAIDKMRFRPLGGLLGGR